MRYPPPRQKVSKVFEGETLGLDFRFEEVRVRTFDWVSGGEGLSSCLALRKV